MRNRTSLLLILGLGVSLSSFSTTAAAECAVYEDYYHPLDTIALLNYPRDVVKNGSTMYVTGELDEMLILDLSDPLNMRQIASCYLGETVRDLTVKGSVVFLLMQSHMLSLIDLYDPEAPIALGSCEIPSRPLDIALAGTYAYVVAGGYGQPDPGIYVVDIDNPMAPEVIEWLDVGYYPSNIVVQGNYAYVLDWISMHILDLSSPEAPVLVGSCAIPGEQRYLTVRGNYAYVVCRAEEWPAEGDGLYIINVTDPASPWIEGDLSGDPEEVPNGPVALWDQYALVGHDGGCAFIDVSDPTTPWLAWFTGDQGPPSDMIVDGDILYHFHGTLSSYLLRDSFTPEIIAEVPDTENSRYMRTRGDYCYAVQTTTNTLNVIDMSNPENPVLSGSEEMGFESAYGIALTEDVTKTALAFVGGGGAYGEPEGFSIVDITDPTDPELLGTVSLPFGFGEFDIEGQYLYMPADHGEIEIYDISNPLSPVYVDSMEFIYNVSFVEVVGETMYIGRRTGYHSGLFIVDVSDPYNPVLIGESTLPRTPFEFAVREPYIYVADYDGGLLILDATNPGDIELASRTETTKKSQSLELVGNYAYVADMENRSGVQVIDISDPYAPRVVGNCQADYPRELVYINEHLLAGCMHYPAVVIPLICEISATDDFIIEKPEPEPVTLGIAINPSPGVCGIKLSLERSRSIELTIHDVQGRLIRRLYQGRIRAGGHELIWNGMDLDGVCAPAGAYFARLRYGDGESVQRIVLIR